MQYTGATALFKYRRVGGREVCVEGFGVSLSGADFSADLGGSSKYSNENFEG